MFEDIQLLESLSIKFSINGSLHNWRRLGLSNDLYWAWRARRELWNDVNILTTFDSLKQRRAGVISDCPGVDLHQSWEKKSSYCSLPCSADQQSRARSGEEDTGITISILVISEVLKEVFYQILAFSASRTEKKLFSNMRSYILVGSLCCTLRYHLPP